MNAGHGSGLRKLPTTVLVLGAVSFLTDLSSEMIYPLLPVFLATVLAAGPVALGWIEGVAESTAALIKLAAGVRSDRVRRRKPLILGGYALAGLVRPLIGLATSWLAVLGLRFADRIGKGLRTAPRDALIADVTAPEERGHAFGVQRALDHAGAVAGPLVAAALLTWAGLGLRAVFLLAAVPAALVVVVIVLGVREAPAAAHDRPALRLRGAWSQLDVRFRLFLAAMLVFTLGNSTDAFILLRLQAAGVSAAGVAVVWAAFHVVKMVATYLGGRLSDRLGRRPMVLAGWAVYAVVYLAFALVDTSRGVLVTFFCYGVYYGLTEPVERAWASELAPAGLRGTALGLYHGVVGLGALPASVLFGLVWQRLGTAHAFALGAVLAAVAAVLLTGVRPRPAAA